jgi:deoxyadenosine/deoxycytidine kinase
MKPPRPSVRVALVGPCAVGKSSIAAALRERGWDVRQPAQEHSGVPDMWRRMSRPDVLIYLDASYETIRGHRPRIDWGEAYLATLNERLQHARRNANLVLCVDGRSLDQSLAEIEAFLAPLAQDPGPARDP